MHDDDLTAHLAALPPTEVLYTDLDGTLLGPGGSLLTAPDGTPSVRAAQALVDAAAGGLAVVPVSGRARVQLQTDTRLLGLSGCIAEAGSVIVRRGAVHYEWGEAPEDLADTPHDALEAAGALSVVLDRFPDDLRLYEPWSSGREGGHLLHGVIDVAEANRVLEEAGLGWAYVVDNGRAGGWPGREVHAYHLLPRGVGKAVAVRDDLRDRGVAAEAAAAVGDSHADAEMAEVVGTYLQVANGHAALGRNRFGLSAAMGHGFAEAVAALLAGR
jgi:phosphoglycolate phosphatase